MSRNNSRLRRGFTLIELLLVMVIIVVLAALVVPRFAGRSEEARVAAATTQLAHFGTALATYEVDNGHYPSTAQGLRALREKPSTAPEPKKWKNPYLQGEVPQDPWGNDYVYKAPGTHNKDGFDLHSLGPDAREGTEDDVTNW